MKENNVLGVALLKEACPVCGKLFDGELVINTHLNPSAAKKVGELRGQVSGFMKQPCDECKDLMTKGFIIIGADRSKTDDATNPYRTGHMFVVTMDYAERLFDGNIPKKGAAFMDINDLKNLGFLNEQK